MKQFNLNNQLTKQFTIISAVNRRQAIKKAVELAIELNLDHADNDVAYWIETQSYHNTKGFTELKAPKTTVEESHITPYKGRELDYSQTVMIYKNLTNGLWSIKQGGKVVGHTNCFLLRSTEFKVYEATRQRVISERKKYVHAYVIGYLDPKNPLDLEVLELDKRITYNPYKSDSFLFINDGCLTPIKNDGSMYYIHGGNGLGHLHLVKYSA